jgi:hypothetical protein
MKFYVVHADDVGKDPRTCRPIATGDENDLDTPEKFGQWLNSIGATNPAAIVDEQGNLLVSDPRYFSGP